MQSENLLLFTPEFFSIESYLTLNLKKGYYFNNGKM